MLNALPDSGKTLSPSVAAYCATSVKAAAFVAGFRSPTSSKRVGNTSADCCENLTVISPAIVDSALSGRNEELSFS